MTPWSPEDAAVFFALVLVACLLAWPLSLFLEWIFA